MLVVVVAAVAVVSQDCTHAAYAIMFNGLQDEKHKIIQGMCALLKV